MNRLFTRVAAAAGSLALAGTAIVMTAAPAAASGNGSSSYGATATAGPTTATPQGLATSTGASQVFVPNVDIAGLLTTGLTLDTASTHAAYSRVTSVRAQMSGGGHTLSLTANQVASTCNVVGTPTASANLIKGVLTVDGTAVALPSHPTAGQVITNGVGTVTLNTQPTVNTTGIEDQAVKIQFTGTSPATVLYIAVTVCNPSGTPNNTITVTGPGDKTNNSGTAITDLPISASDSDASQTLTYSAGGTLPPGLTIDASTGVISGTPTTGRASPYAVTITVTDTTGASGTATFDWTINNVVTVTHVSDQSTASGVSVNLSMSATDSNPSITTFTWGATGLPPGLNINTSTGAITGSSTTLGTTTVTVTATDSTGRSGSTTFTWTITSS